MLRRVLISAAVVAMTLGLASAGHADSKSASQSTLESNKTRMRMFYDDIMNKKKLDVLNDYIDAGFVEHETAPGFTPDRDGTKKFFTMWFAAFPDLKVTVNQILAEGDLVATAVTFTGTQKGEFMGAPASGKVMTITGLDIVRIKDGKATEHWGASDHLTMMQQLGMMPH